MKKVFFAVAVATVLAMASCKQTPAVEVVTESADSTVVVADSAAVAVDTVAVK